MLGSIVSAELPGELEVIGHAAGEDAVRNRLRQVRIVIVRPADAVIGRQGARREVVGNPRVENAEIPVQLAAVIAGDVEGRAHARRPVVLQGVVLDDRAAQGLLLVAQPGIDGQALARLPGILHEQGVVVLQWLTARR